MLRDPGWLKLLYTVSALQRQERESMATIPQLLRLMPKLHGSKQVMFKRVKMCPSSPENIVYHNYQPQRKMRLTLSVGPSGEEWSRKAFQAWSTAVHNVRDPKRCRAPRHSHDVQCVKTVETLVNEELGP